MANALINKYNRIGIIILVFVIIFLAGRLIAYKKLLNSTIKEQNQELLYKLNSAENRINGFKTKEILEHQTDHSYISNLVLSEIGKDITVRLKDVVGDYLLLYRFTQNSCIDCVINDLASLKKYSDKIGVNNIIIIGGYEAPRDLLAITKSYNLPFRSFNYFPPLEIPLQSPNNYNSVPFFILVKNNLEIVFPYYRDDEIQNERYLDRIAIFFESINQEQKNGNPQEIDFQQ